MTQSVPVGGRPAGQPQASDQQTTSSLDSAKVGDSQGENKAGQEQKNNDDSGCGNQSNGNDPKSNDNVENQNWNANDNSDSGDQNLNENDNADQGQSDNDGWNNNDNSSQFGNNNANDDTTRQSWDQRNNNSNQQAQALEATQSKDHSQQQPPNDNSNAQPQPQFASSRPKTRPLYGPHGSYFTLQPASITTNGAQEALASASSPSPPPYDVPSPIARTRPTTHQVQMGKGYRYYHERATPEYLDTLAEPYARFIFLYRTKEQIQQLLGIQIPCEPSGDEGKRLFMDKSQEELIDMLIRAKEVLGGKLPSPPPAPPPGLEGVGSASGAEVFVPAPVPAPEERWYLKYSIPPGRYASANVNANANANASSGPADGQTSGLRVVSGGFQQQPDTMNPAVQVQLNSGMLQAGDMLVETGQHRRNGNQQAGQPAQNGPNAQNIQTSPHANMATNATLTGVPPPPPGHVTWNAPPDSGLPNNSSPSSSSSSGPNPGNPGDGAAGAAGAGGNNGDTTKHEEPPKPPGGW